MKVSLPLARLLPLCLFALAARADPAAAPATGTVPTLAAQKFTAAHNAIQQNVVNKSIAFCEYNPISNGPSPAQPVGTNVVAQEAESSGTSVAKAITELKADFKMFNSDANLGNSTFNTDGLPFNTAMLQALRNIQYRDQDPDKGGYDYYPLFSQCVQKNIEADGVISTNTGSSNYKCSQDLKTLSDNLTKRQTWCKMMATSKYPAVLQLVIFSMRDFKNAFAGKKFMFTGKCDGVPAAVEAIRQGLQDQYDVTHQMIDYNNSQGTALGSFATTLQGVQAGCTSAGPSSTIK